MSSRKERQRLRRRVEKLLRDAWEHLARGEPHLARKLAERALADGDVNPRVWVEVGEIQAATGEPHAAERAFRAAAELAPTYRPALERLVAYYADQGLVREARSFQARLAALDPTDAAAAQRLAALHAELASLRPALESSPASPQRSPPSERLRSLPLERMAEEVLARGAFALPAFAEGEAFAHDVAIEPRDAAPTARLTNDVLHLLRALAAERTRRLGPSARGNEPPPPHLEPLHPAPTASPTLSPWPGAHRCGPVGLLLTIRGAGTFLQEDRGLGKRSRRLEFALRPGDALLFALRDRLVGIGGAVGLQPVVQGFAVREAPFALWAWT